MNTTTPTAASRKYDLEIVTHCYAVTLPFYAAQLQFQVASLLYYCPRSFNVCCTVFTTHADKLTLAFCNEAKVHVLQNLTINCIALSPGSLYRRAVGRNIRALANEANVYWFADVDYFFGQGCIESLLNQVNADSGLVYPRHVQISPDHAAGDALTAGITQQTKLFPFAKRDQFVQIEQKRCIGGLHIIGANRLAATNPETGNAFGYINGHAKCRPVDAEQGFAQCRCDIPFKSQHGPATQIDIKSVFRIRHTTAGRAYDQAGNRTQEMKGGHD